MFDYFRYSLIRLYRWIRFRHGHGVHSPFAFAFINDVVEEKNGYYAYKKIYEQITRVQISPVYTKETPLKYLLLLYRISNYFRPNKIIRLGTEGGASVLYLQALLPNAECTLIESDKRKIESVLSLIDSAHYIRVLESTEKELVDKFSKLLSENRHTGLVVIHSSIAEETKQIALEMCLKEQKERTLLIWEGIDNSCKAKQSWIKLVKDQRISVSFDLIHWGIAVIDPHLKKRDYKLFF